MQTLAQLYEGTHNYDESARNYYALYNLARTDDKAASAALGGLARLILSAPEQAIRLGSGNLSLYRDVATMDPHPGFLNGALSLLLNSSNPGDRYQQEETNAGPYFRRAKGAELIALFESRFPNAPERTDLRERVIEGYAAYGVNDAVIRAGVKFLADFPNAANRTSVALRVADAYARTNKTAQEFALYDTLLLELAKRADGVPLGALPPAKSPPVERPDKAAPVPQFDSLRSPDYARVLDRYVARLVSLKRTAMRSHFINVRSTAIRLTRASTIRSPRSSNRTILEPKLKPSINAPSLNFRITAGSINWPAGICARSVRPMSSSSPATS